MQPVGKLVGDDIQISANHCNRSAQFVCGEGNKIQIFFFRHVPARFVDEKNNRLPFCAFFKRCHDVVNFSSFNNFRIGGDAVPALLGFGFLIAYFVKPFGNRRFV